MIDYSAPDFWPILIQNVLQGLVQTLYMTGVALLVTIVIGLPLGILLVGTERRSFLERIGGSRGLSATINRILNFVVNLGRSVPFIILMIALIPFTRLVIGTFIGTTAAIVPLSVVAIPFFARMVEIAVREIDPGLIEAADSLGATRRQLVSKVLVPETAGALLLGLSTTVTSIINFSAMVGVVGGGGLGQVAYSYGYQRYSTAYIVVVIIVIFVIVMVVQILAGWAARRLAHRIPTTKSRTPLVAPPT